ncbi:flagellar biosynthesis protein FlhF [Paraneptunicella aestuarii]|uniref:flagellar biosynthesis protein FlhF n=1 Tax=Paraneptunicella aestuarii TaxID=2831148 RepID=UPI001E47B5C0|nr:flagellar biosynthesis protein FlhF [Paraneptunicella aestuarii]UAA38154.1 flagellar biosynthesis protein FlhF [Paraneptunicella aestuarii]
MKIRRFYGKDMRDALNQVKEELGGDAVIMSNKKVGDGIEIVAAYDKEPAPKMGTPKPVASNPIPELAKAPVAPKGKRSPTLSEVIGESGSDSLKALLEKQYKATGTQSADAEVPELRNQRAPYQPAAAAKMSVATSKEPASNVTAMSAHTKRDLPQEPVSNSAMDDIRQELKSLRDVLEFQVSGLINQEKKRSHPLQAYLTSRLLDMGINRDLAEEVVSYAPENCDEREAWLFILKLLANRLKTGSNDILEKGGVVALVGPTGCGKTTTIAKLAAQFAQKHGADQVAMVTIDSYRIAAYDQLATYGKILGCPVKKASNAQELSDVLYQFRNKRLVLIDTAGFGQRDTRLIKQLEALSSKTNADINMYLVVQANTQRQVLEQTFTAFQQDMMKGCIFTKLDECYSLGEAVSVAIQKRVPVSYLTDGQRVPEDLKLAEAKYLVSAAAKLYKKYCLPHTTAEQFKQSAVAV